MENWFTPVQPSALPVTAKVLVLAPHPDDEVFGCGGAVALYARQAVAVHMHILTDGAGYAGAHEREQIQAVRQEESRQALGHLEAQGSKITVDFGPYQDRALLRQTALVQHILALLQQHKPGLVIAPSPWEIHPDHQACARATLAAVVHWQRTAAAANVPDLLLYEVGSPVRANFLLDITAVWPQKKQAMLSFRSQQQQQDYSRHIQGLNEYRTYTLPAHVHYAEAFHYLSADDISAMAQNDSGLAQPAVQCMDRWLESVLHSASVHTEALQHALVEQTRQTAALQHDLTLLQQSRAVRWARAIRRLLPK